MINQQRPTYEISVGAGFFCVINSKDNRIINYQDKITRLDTIRSLGITPTATEQEIWASGSLFDFISQISGATISLTAVAIPPALLSELSGATTKNGFTFNRVNDLEKEFAFGYWGENRDGTFVFYWHPVCKLAPGEDTKNTRTNESPDPQKNYSIKIIPYDSDEDGAVWRVTYNQASAIAMGQIPLSIDDFFSQVIYSPSMVPSNDI